MNKIQPKYQIFEVVNLVYFHKGSNATLMGSNLDKISVSYKSSVVFSFLYHHDF